MKNCIIKNKNGVSYLQFIKLLEYEDIVKHAITLKPFDIGSNNTYFNNKKTIEDNYKKICNILQMDYKNIYRPYQTHTDKVYNINNEKPGTFIEELKDVDAVVTNKKDKILTIGTADCIDIMFFDPVKKVIANTHSGWKGTYQEIAVKTVENMVENYGSKENEILCFLDQA